MLLDIITAKPSLRLILTARHTSANIGITIQTALRPLSGKKKIKLSKSNEWISKNNASNNAEELIDYVKSEAIFSDEGSEKNIIEVNNV